MVWLVLGITALVVLSSDHSWQSPQPYIDHRDGGGTPPGTER